MIRVMAVDVVNAYKKTGLIPIRQARSSQRGGCAISALIRSLGTDWALRLNQDYLLSFLTTWDADDPSINFVADDVSRHGARDAIFCREAVEKEFSSAGIY